MAAVASAASRRDPQAGSDAAQCAAGEALMLHRVPRARHWWGLFKEASIYQNRAERAMQRGEYLAAIDECQMGKARILKRNKKSLHSAFYSGYPRTLTFEMLHTHTRQELLESSPVDRHQDEWYIEFMERFRRYIYIKDNIGYI